MKAVVCHTFDGPDALVIEDRPRPVPGPGQVLVETHAVGLNYVEVLVTSGRSLLKRNLPLIPGVEGAGVVLEVGPGVTKVKPGQRVLGSKVQGTLAEEVIYEEDELAAIPDKMDMKTAAVFYIAAMTVWYSLRPRAKLKAGENLLVLGAGGGCGLASVEIGKAIGARVVAAASSQAKLDLARQRGADACVLYPKGPLDLTQQKAFAKELLAHGKLDHKPIYVKEQAELYGKMSTESSNGYHVVMDGVGGTYAEPALRTLVWEGRFVSYGFAAGMAHVALGPALFKNADIMGIQPSTDEYRMPGRNPIMMKELFQWYVEGKLRPLITNTLPLTDVSKALGVLGGREATGRLVLMTSRAKE